MPCLPYSTCIQAFRGEAVSRGRAAEVWDLCLGAEDLFHTGSAGGASLAAKQVQRVDLVWPNTWLSLEMAPS